MSGVEGEPLAELSPHLGSEDATATAWPKALEILEEATIRGVSTSQIRRRFYGC
jgi:hypothetical protein